MQKTLISVFLFFFSILLLSDTAFSQNKEIDSLEFILKTAKSDTDKINISYDLCVRYKEISEYNKALKNGVYALKLSEKINDQSGIANISNVIGTVYKSVSDYPKALDYFFRSLKIHEKLGAKEGMAIALGSIGETYRLSGDLKRSLEYQLKALKLREETKNKIGIAGAQNNIGNTYFEQKDYAKAIDYYTRCLITAKELDNKYGIALTLNNLGSVYYNLVELEKSLNYYLQSAKLCEEIDDKQGVAMANGNIASIYQRQGKYKEALVYGTKAVKICREIGDLNNEQNYQETLYVIYKQMGNPSESLKHFERAMLLKDSVFKEENKEEITRKEMNYQFEKKEAIAQLEQEKKDIAHNIQSKHQNMIIYLVSAGLLLVVIFSFFLYNRFKLTQRQKNIIENQKVLVDEKNNALNELNEELNQQNEEIASQRDEIEIQKDLVEEKHKEITDSINYAERIQRSFLASKELLTENLSSPRGGVEVGGGYFVFFKPKDVVSGDFYWAGKLSNGNFALATADSTGHGVPGAIMSILNISSLEQAVELGMTESAEILNKTRKTIIERLKKDGSPEGGKDGMDASLICFDFLNNKLNYSAANNPVWVIRKKSSEVSELGSSSGFTNDKNNNSDQSLKNSTTHELIELPFDKMPVGKHDKDQVPFTQHLFALQKEDVVYTLTDGMPDQFGGPKGKKFLYKQLKELLISISKEPMEIQKQKLNDAFENWKGNLEQVDDVCVIGVKI